MSKVGWWGYPVILMMGVTGVAWLLRSTLTLANFTMIYILVVLMLAIYRGTRMALLGAFMSFLCINFFLIHPYYTFLVADPREVIDLIVFFVVAVLVGQMATRAHKSQQFEDADRLKTALLHAVSHDLRTPVTIIKTTASNLKAPGEHLSPTDRNELAQTIEHQADQLDALIGNLLDISRLRAGTMTLNCQMNALEEVAGDIAASVYQNTGLERIRLTFPEDFPLVSFDYGLMLRAITNLVDNALRYALPHTLVEIRGEVVRQKIRLMVINQGENIPDTEHAHIMEPFYVGGGGHIGLGVPIAKGIVEAHQGRMSLENTPGGGATFVITLPLQKEALNVD